MDYVRGKNSWLIRLFLIIYDIFIVNIIAYYLLDFNKENLYFFSTDLLNNKNLLYFIYSIIFWLSSTFLISFYRVFRYTSPLNIFTLLIKQFLIYSLIVFAFEGIFRSINVSVFVTFKYIIICFLCISFVKLLSFYLLKTYRAYLKGNIRNIVIVGGGKNINDLRNIFTKRKELGYNLKAIFSDSNEKNLQGDIAKGLKFLEKNHDIDEVFCAIDDLTEKQVNELVKYSTINHYNIKFVPDTFKFFTKRLRTDYFNYLPVLSIQKTLLNRDFNKLIKRVFDIIFSLLVIIFVLSWLSILLFILLKLESKGPLFYKHKRNGINYKEFYCYKFRTLVVDQKVKRTYVKLNDERVTRIGKILRKTSIDELPQFFNVLKNDMSVVGPRPHMLSYTDDYSKKIDKYNFIFRHHVKPGITGLAQIKGYRGEIENDKDIINRIKYDIFYIENWSLLLDMKIVILTLYNILKGEKKAY